MRHFLCTRVFAAPAPVAALALGVTVPAASRVLIPASRRAQRFTPSGAAATCPAVLLAPVATRADEHLAPASGTQKQSGIVHCSPRRGGLDDPRLPGNTALGAVRQCGSGRSLGRDRQVNVVRGCAGLPDHCDLTPTAERRHRTGAPRRHLLVGNIGSGGRQRQAPGRGTGTTQSSSAPISQIQFTRAVRRIAALLRSRLHVSPVRSTSRAARYSSCRMDVISGTFSARSAKSCSSRFNCRRRSVRRFLRSIIEEGGSNVADGSLVRSRVILSPAPGLSTSLSDAAGRPFAGRHQQVGRARPAWTSGRGLVSFSRDGRVPFASRRGPCERKCYGRDVTEGWAVASMPREDGWRGLPARSISDVETRGGTAFEERHQTILQPVPVLGIALPHDLDPPTRLLQTRHGNGVPLPVRGELVRPEFPAGLGCGGSFASFVTVPETAVDENHLAATTKHDVGAARKVAGMQPKSVAFTMKKSSNDHFRAGVSPANLPHQGASGGIRSVVRNHSFA